MQIYRKLEDFGGIYFGVIYSTLSLAEEVTSCLAFSLIYMSPRISTDWLNEYPINTFEWTKRKKEWERRGGIKAVCWV